MGSAPSTTAKAPSRVGREGRRGAMGPFAPMMLTRDDLDVLDTILMRTRTNVQA